MFVQGSPTCFNLNLRSRASTQTFAPVLFALACLIVVVAAPVSTWAQTNCAACWGAVTNWHGTWNLTLTGSSINDSSQGTFDITNGAHTVTGTGSVSGSFAGYCAETGSGALDASSSALVVINTTDCTFSLILNDRLMVSETITGYGTINSIQGVSGTTVSPVGTVPESALPYFPLPAFGEPLVISGSFPAPNPGVACYDFGGGATLTISCTIEPQVQTGPPHFTRLPTGGPLGCNPADIPGAADVLGDTSATSPSGQVSVSADVVDVTNGCTVTRSFTITATDECTEQEAHALVAYSWTEDTTPPVITGAPTGGSLGCNPASLPTDASVLAQVTSTDDCGVASNIVSHVDTTNNCTVTRTFTVTAIDNCGNVSTARTAVFTWTADTTPPVITGAPAGGSLGCNPASPPTDAGVRALVTATDGCGSATINVSHSDSVANCTTTRTFTITATDNCGNASPARTAVFTWTSDTTPPTFTQLPPGGYLGTNPPTIPDDGAALAMTQASDTCGSPSINISHVDTGTPALYTRTFTIAATDTCGNSSVANPVYTWTGTNNFSPPILNILSLGSNVLLHWATNATGFSLTARSNFNAASSWNLVTNLPAVIGDQFMVTNSASGPTRFYRLVK